MPKTRRENIAETLQKLMDLDRAETIHSRPPSSINVFYVNVTNMSCPNALMNTVFHMGSIN